METYEESWREWRANPELFWSKSAAKLQWIEKWDKIVDTSDPKRILWFPDGKLNLCYNCLDHKVQEGYGDKTILFHESLYTHEVKRYTYGQLLDQVSRLAGALYECGVRKGDFVLINLPMIPETVIAILAAVRIGAPYYVISRGYTPQSLKTRIEETKPKIIFSTNYAFIDDNIVCFKSIIDEVMLNSQHSPKHCIILQRKFAEPAKLTANRDFSWNEFIERGKFQECTPTEGCDPLFLLYTSGSTGNPKGVIYSVGSFSVGMVQDDFKSWHFDGEVYWCLSEFSWIGGHLNNCFIPLLSKTATILFEGPPYASCLGEMYRIYKEYGVTNTYIPVSTLKTFRNKDPNNVIAKKYGPFLLKTVTIAGSTIDELTLKYTEDAFKTSVILIYGQTEFGGPVTLSWPEQPKFSSGKPYPGWEMKVLRDDGSEAEVGEVGHIAIRQPCGPGLLSNFFLNENYLETSFLTKFPGYFDTKDQGKFDEQGYLYIDCRTDCVIKIKGDRFSCDGIEQAIMKHPAISECIVVGKPLNDVSLNVDPFVPAGFYVIHSGINVSADAISKELKEQVCAVLGPQLSVLELYDIKKMPKTMAGKPARGQIQNLVSNLQSLTEFPSDVDGLQYIWRALKIE